MRPRCTVTIPEVARYIGKAVLMPEDRFCYGSIVWVLIAGQQDDQHSVFETATTSTATGKVFIMRS